MQTHRQIAKRKTVLWQAGAIAVLIAAGVAIGVPSVRNLIAPPPKVVEKKPVASESAPKINTDNKTPPLSEAIHSLTLVNGWTKPPEIPTPTVDPAGVGVAPPPPPIVSDWIYAGSFITSRSRAALVKIDANQQVIALNAVVNDTKLVTIEPDYIEIERGGVKKHIDLAARPALNMPTDPPRKAVSFRTGPNLTGGAPGMAIPSMAHSAMAQPPTPQTFDQARAQAQAAREALARSGQPQMPPPTAPVVEMDGQKYEAATRDEAIKNLMEPDQPPEMRIKYLEALGIKPGMPVETATAIAQKMGLDPNSDGGRHIMETLKNNANPAESKESK